ncbi:hypothetical protein LAV73_04805 [Lysinibacillus xylanilyticus]|uniref:hypothetical protein n=1 Tax=Lysinibacillus xylanilyticus TaxID=582475 RepID=UPI002B247783|nr:hypothetical protein [Lysinibacillus xylanilyticus]MEB2279325.1 hypothetical protein [Lysinibacillus xylanilyticus]
MLYEKAKRQQQKFFSVRKRSVSNKAPSRNGNQPQVMVTILFSLQKLSFHLYLQLVNRNDFELERREHT